MLEEEGIQLPMITTLHGTDITLVGAERAYKEVTRFGVRESDGVTAVSRWLEEETRRIFGVTREMRVIPNFVDTERFSPGSEIPYSARNSAASSSGS